MACDGDVVRVPGDTIDSIAHDSYGTDAGFFVVVVVASLSLSFFFLSFSLFFSLLRYQKR